MGTIKTSEFLAAFRGYDEPLPLRAFKPKKAPNTPENSAQKWTTTLVDLTQNAALQADLRTKNQHCGIYFVVNAGGDTDASITRYTAFFAEADNRPLSEQHEAFDSAPLQPSIRVETRSSVHAYWSIAGECSQAEWREVQGRLIVYFDSDPKIKNPARVMRVPGFDHLHLNGHGLEKKKVMVHTFEPERRFTVSEMLEAFPAPINPAQAQHGPTSGPYEYHEDRHAELVQRIMSRGKRNSKGNWDARAICHEGTGDKGAVYFPATGAVVCNNTPKCDYFAILRAEGLPDGHLPSRETATKKSQQAPVKVGKPPNISSASELMARVFNVLRWAVLNLLCDGVFILAGAPKLGKSWIVWNICVAVASGGRALGTIRVDAGDVLYLPLEDGQRRAQDRLRITLAGEAVPENLFVATEWPRFDEGGLDAIREWLEQHPKARLIAIDTLKKVRPIEHTRGRLYDGDYDAIGPLGDLAREFGVCCLVVHHTRKMYSPDPLDLVSGSLGLTGAADGVLVLKRARGEADATLHASGRDFEDQELALRWDKEVIGWRVLGDAAEYRLSNERQEVLAMLRTSRTVTPKVAADLLGKTVGATRKLLWTMSKAGELHVTGKGVYSLPQALTAPPNGEAGRYQPVFDDPDRQAAWDSWEGAQ